MYRRKALGPSLICRGMDQYSHIYQCREPKHIDFEKLQGRILDNLLQVLTPEFCQKLISEPLDTTRLERKVRDARDSRDVTKRELAWLVTQGRKGMIPDDIFDLQLTAVKDELQVREEQL